MIEVTPQRKAFLDMIAVSEGTKGKGDDGYNVLYGGGTFNSYLDHPRRALTYTIKGKRVTSTAAGRYQLLARYYDAYRKMLGLPDFTPSCQDQIALQQIKERGALREIDAGLIPAAIARCRNIWASFPGAGYNQHEQSMETLIAAFKKAGGKVA